MVSFETVLGWVVPSIITIAITVIVMVRKDFSLTKDKTAKSAFTLESQQSDISEIKNDIKQGFDRQSNQMDKRFDEMRAEVKYIYGRIEAAERDIFNIRWRVEQIEKRNGGTKSPV